ncbi:XIAP-associated factor 1 isoform X2 [Vigna radiata var. radiata]|uniref:XIAP-associated factor 1 isoform X2 n=1 Tax=Vigna radiata var. radiata TaxID=3916 RepID=A0A1S3UHA0_VIGRR|nr:XIAP-associated factor 1 isoform X2 [Vigna radiata var. radiata]
MEAVPDQDISICTHCDRAVPVANIDLHYAHCSRKLEKCKICGDMVPRKNVEDHYSNTHAPVPCSLCSETMERDILDIHKGEECPQRIVTCEFCEFPLPAIDLAEHQEVCGNRTELCHICNKYVRLRERFSHEARCNGIIQDTSVGSSRHKSSFESSFNMLSCKEYWSLKWNVRETEGDPAAARRRPQNDFSTKRLLFTIAITGIAVILGSFFLQRKAEPSDVH